MDFELAILDEIALEGLDGITVQGLITRLRDRKPTPCFMKGKEASIRNLVIEIAVGNNEIRVFLLSESRPNLHVFNRYDHVDQELGIVFEPDDLEIDDVYPFAVVNNETPDNGSEDTDNKEKGSCAEYKVRKLT